MTDRELGELAGHRRGLEDAIKAVTDEKAATNKHASRADRMKVVDYGKVADHVYEVVIHSPGRGLVTRRVLVLPGSAMGSPASGQDCGDR